MKEGETRQGELFGDMFGEGKKAPEFRRPNWMSREQFDEMIWKKKYEAYIRSSEWQTKRKELFAKRGRKCEICGTESEVHVHHLTYERLGNEKLSDLQIVCEEHHPLADKMREKAVQQKSEDKMWQSGFETWHHKKYGDDTGAHEGDFQEYCDWVERKQSEGH